MRNWCYTQRSGLSRPTFLVASVPAAIGRFIEAGGKVLAGPFEIRIGLCAMIEDPWQNRLVILDLSKGSLRTDAEGNVLESGAA